MIVPPMNTGAFYSVLFEEPIAVKLVKLLAPTASDVDKVILTSIDLSDIEATNELDAAVSGLLSDQEQKHTLHFNPIYLPLSADEITTKLEFDRDGDLAAVDGFESPFMSARIRVSTDQHQNLIDGSVNFNQFELPKMRDMIEMQVVPS